MPLDIWTTDPDNKPEPRQSYSDDTVGRLHSGYVDTSGDTPYPVALSEWRVSTGDREVARAVAELFGGTPVENEESQSENFIDVYTSRESVPVIIEPDGITSDMKQWSNGKLIHHCTGAYFLSHPTSDDRVGEPCGCPVLFAERKEAARAGIGPAPSITVRFKFVDDPSLGEFRWQTGAWSLAAVLHDIEGPIAQHGGPVSVTLTLEEVSYVAKIGKMKGKRVEYTKPVMKVVGAYDDATE